MSPKLFRVRPFLARWGDKLNQQTSLGGVQELIAAGAGISGSMVASPGLPSEKQRKLIALVVGERFGFTRTLANELIAYIAVATDCRFARCQRFPGATSRAKYAAQDCSGSDDGRHRRPKIDYSRVDRSDSPTRI